jgi:uncharacterized protein (UPF0332 family)/predicted nucleotidyltransferase
MSALAEATLTQQERDVIDRLVELLRAELDLRAVWLYGSRARGEQPGPDSDVDLLVITGGGRDRDGDRVRKLVNQVVAPGGANFVPISTQVFDPEWVTERREIEAFFIQEVDRDKIVLFGSADGGARAPRKLPPEPGMMRRSREWMAQARESLAAARVLLDSDVPGLSVSLAYYAGFYAARAALSEEDIYARTHGGTWDQFWVTFVDSGRFDPTLFQPAREAERARIDSDYNAVSFDRETAEAIAASAERFLVAVEQMFSE